MEWNRRKVLKTGLSAAVLAAASARLPAEETAALAGEVARRYAFEQRGYYIPFMRGPLFTFETWKGILDGVKEDGGNLVILWMAGAFRSRRYPITWKYNAEHENVRHNFAGGLIDHAHGLGLRVLLGLTPYGYDGVNQYAIEHPELKAIQKNGNYTAKFGLDAWGFNLNPYKPAAEAFMLDYTREMLEFYPHADGLLLESSDYAVSYCGTCAEGYYAREFAFVRKISDELWARKPDAMIAVYPHYFSGAETPGLNVRGAREKFDPRWTLFFTPHSTTLDRSLIREAKSSLYWDPSVTFGKIDGTKAAAQVARAAGITGFTPSFEPCNYVFTGPDMGSRSLIGQRASPFGMGWLRPGETPMHELLLRVNRLAYREFSRSPDGSMETFRQAVARELLQGDSALLDDLLFTEESFFLDRTYDSTAAIASPEYVKGRIDQGELGPARLEEYRERRKRIARIALQYRGDRNPRARELARSAEWITAHWEASAERGVIEEQLGG